MTFKALVLADRPDEYVGKRGLVKQQLLSLIDVSETGMRLQAPLEYALSDEEKLSLAGKLADKFVVLEVREMTPYGGRLRVRGKVTVFLGK